MDWSRFDRERFRKIMAVALRAEGAEALTALQRARSYLDGAGGSIDDVLGGTVTVHMHGAREGAKKPNGHSPTAPTNGAVNDSAPESRNGGPNGQAGPKPAPSGSDDDPLRHALYASRIVTQLRTENRRLNDLLDQATRYIAELESEVSRSNAPRASGPPANDPPANDPPANDSDINGQGGIDGG